MGLFDNLESQAEAIAAKAGISPDQVRSISSSLQSQIGDGSNQIAALESVAKEHGLPVDKIQEVLGHAGDSGGLVGKIGGFAKSFLGG